jgi:hypothetical protein
LNKKRGEGSKGRRKVQSGEAYKKETTTKAGSHYDGVVQMDGFN